MHQAGFEPTIPASERPQTHALDRAATRCNTYVMLYILPTERIYNLCSVWISERTAIISLYSIN
jgi:hypothetical protein